MYISSYFYVFMKTKLPKIIKDFLIYLSAIKGKSLRTRKEYEYDLVLFFQHTGVGALWH